MSVIELDCKRSRGRPQARQDDETRHLIAEAARRSFMSCGYAGTNMDTVAKCAGVSKKTLYRLVPGKADLFRAAVSDRIAGFLLTVDQEVVRSLDVAAGLERLLTEFGNLVLADQTIALYKLVIAESDRFPELAIDFYTDAIQGTLPVLEDFLRRHCASGALTLDDPHEAAGMLRGMMILEPQRAVMMGKAPTPSPAEIAVRAKACARLFLGGCLARPPAAATSLP
jgi:AcrR family transcriptional regulator